MYYQDGYFAYVVYLKKQGKRVYTKIGYTKNPRERFYKLTKNFDKVEPVIIYHFNEKSQALLMESLLRRHFVNQGKILIKNDYFKGFQVNKNNLKKIEKSIDYFKKV
jgi:hypothetical protein